MKKIVLCLLTIAIVCCACLFALAETSAVPGDIPATETEGDSPVDDAPKAPSVKPLTYEDLGIQVQEKDAAKASYLNPRTYVITQDNENNNHTGTADNDMNYYLYAQNSKSPIEVRFDLDVLPQRDAYVAITAWDCDEYNGDMPEYDAVYVNDTRIGAMTGENGEWNTTTLRIPADTLKLGANYVTIHIGAVDKTVSPWQYYEYYANRWAIKVSAVQLLLDGGNHEHKPDRFFVNLRNAQLIDQNVYCEAAVEIEAQESRDYEVEYSLVDRSSTSSETYLQIISTDVSSVSGTKVETYGTLHMPLASPVGIYSVQVLLRIKNSQDILAADEKYFYFDGTLPSFDILNLRVVLSEEGFTPGPITMYVSADISNPSVINNVQFWLNETVVCDAQIDANGHATGSFKITENGEYLVEIRYVRDGKTRNAMMYVTIANITELKGDVNGDGVVNDLDLELIRNYLLGLGTLTEDQITRGDMDGDGIITGVDYLMIRRVVLGL